MYGVERMAEFTSTVLKPVRATSLAKWKIRPSLTWILVAVSLLAALTMAVAWLKKPSQFHGRILSSQTQQPIRDALVAVESMIPFSDENFGCYVRTDQEGRFVAEVKGEKVSIRAWKQGYVMNGVDTEVDNKSQPNVTIELRPVEATNTVTSRDGSFRIKFGDGFSLSEGRVVEQPSHADLIIRKGPNPLTVLIEAPGNGGVIFQPDTADLSFPDSPLAPQSGYEKRVVLDFSPDNQTSGFLFVRTSDGSHYAKVAIGISSVTEVGKADKLDMDEVRFTWAYQPDGSRTLELDATKNEFFPEARFSPTARP
jgi:hypothetical protein